MYGAIKNQGIPHLPHEVRPKGQWGKVRRVPHYVKGRRAHPPKPEKILIEKINRKEYTLALASALAATANAERVVQRHHIKIDHAPLILEDAVEKLGKTREVVQLLASLHLSAWIEKAKEKGGKSMLFVVSDASKLKSAGNIAGVDVVDVAALQVRHLAPGTHPGRLTLFSEKALGILVKRIQEKGGNA